MAWNCWKWQEVTGNCRNSWKWLEIAGIAVMARNGWKWQEMAGNGYKWLE